MDPSLGSKSESLPICPLPNRLECAGPINSRSSPLIQPPQQIHSQQPCFSAPHSGSFQPFTTCHDKSSYSSPLVSRSHVPQSSLPISNDSSFRSSCSVDNKPDNSDDDSDDDPASNDVDDVLEKIEIVDGEGNVKMTMKNMKAKDVYTLVSRLRVLVKVNDIGQPIRAARRVLTRYMTKLIKEPNLCPPDLTDFNEVKKIFGVELLRSVREKFCFPPHENVDNVLIALFDTKFRQKKYKIKKMAYETAKTKLREKLKALLEESGYCGSELIDAVKSHVFQPKEIEAEVDQLEDPPGFAPHQWLKFKNDMKSGKAKKQSETGKKARAMQAHTHTTGTKAYAQVKDEHIVRENEDPGPIEFFDMTHKRKDGSYAQDESRHFMHAARTKVAKLKATKPDDDVKELEGDVWHSLMGDDMPGRARGYGIGVTKSQVRGFRAQVKRMKDEGASYNDPRFQIQKLQAIAAQQQRMMAKTNDEVAQLKAELQIYRTAFGAFSGDVTVFPSTQGVHMFGSQNAYQERALCAQDVAVRDFGPSSSRPIDGYELGTVPNLSVRRRSSSEVSFSLNDTDHVVANQPQINGNAFQTEENANLIGASEHNSSSPNAKSGHSRRGHH